ncbi:MAG: hypothetical protein HYT40_01310 [Candidatus Sungbacteria bacterium]|uniref:DUF7282 domain-containing protein n=1 Tax=Candidatus Sungiibacteriota bacterium TaxID=2750080 RepID=A0A931SBD8_9BACT|nr:hypothetical protein [Candidatus Sungbacteria bacterium]
MPTVYSAKQFFGAIIAAIIVAGIAGYFIGSSSSRGGGGENSTDKLINFSTTTADSLILGSNAIAVENQKAGDRVEVSGVTFGADGGWVAIHEDREGKPGNILGARIFPGGETRNGFVELLRPTVNGVYYAMLHRDDGDRQFDYLKDTPLTNSAGNVIMVRFVVSENPDAEL